MASQCAPTTGGTAPSGLASLISFAPLILLFVVFYFLLIRPQQKRQKELQQMLNNLAKGDEVITTGGMFGTVVEIKNEKVTLKIADNVKIDVLKSSIASVIKD